MDLSKRLQMADKPNFEEDLLADLQSDSENETEFVSQKESYETATLNSHVRYWEDLLQSSHRHTVGTKLQHLDIAHVSDPTELSSVLDFIPQIRQKLRNYVDEQDTDYMELLATANGENQSEEMRFLMQISELPTLINDEITLLHRFVRTHYKLVFGELEVLVSNPIDYCRVVTLIGLDLIGIKKKEPELQKIVSNTKVLAISMAALESFAHLFPLNEKDMSRIRKACDLCFQLNDFIKELSVFVSRKLSKYAPNVNSLIGPTVTSQLLISIGSLRQLALTPACNLPSFGVRDILSQQNTRSTIVRATGYLYYSDLVVGLPPEIKRQALRIISSKIILAARIDLSGAMPDGSIGKAYLEEIKRKIDQLLTPPDKAAPKALPVPKEQKSKKRGGRRFRKMRERTQMSEIRKAQSKMVFGKEEHTVIDAFGEEVGLGLSKQIDGVRANKNTNARMSKAMINRLNQQKDRPIDLDTIVFARDEDDNTSPGFVSSNSRRSWFGGAKRSRFADLDLDEEDTKKQKTS